VCTGLPVPRFASNPSVCKPYTIVVVIEVEDHDGYVVPALYEPWSRELIRRAQVWRGDRVVDLACGTGIVACRIAGTGAQVIGVDASAAVLEQAKRRAAEEAVPVSWLMRDPAATTLRSASAELVTCQQGLQFATDRAAVVREARRLLASGGRAVFACWCPIAEQVGHRIIDTVATKHFGGGYGADYSLGEPAEVTSLLGASRFMAIQIETVHRVVRFPEPARFAELALRSIASERGATEAAIVAALAEANEQLAPLVVDGKLEVMTASLIAIGRVSAK
jgi:SAM-dependent methyltransferase